MSDGLVKAQALGAGDAYMAAQVPVLQQIASNQKKTLAGLATKWAGGNKDLADYANAFLTGDPVNAGVAANALINMTRNGIPSGTKITPAAAATIWQRSSQSLRNLTSNKIKLRSGWVVWVKQLSLEKGAVDSRLTELVTNAIQGQYAQSQMDATVQAAHQIPKPSSVPTGSHTLLRESILLTFKLHSNTVTLLPPSTWPNITGLNLQDAGQLLSQGPTGAVYRKLSGS